MLHLLAKRHKFIIWWQDPHERRFGQPFEGPILPFGSLVEYHPITAKDQSRIHQFGKKVLPGLFLGYALYAGRIWKGDVLVEDFEELETMDASEIYSKRLHAKEMIFPKEIGKFFFSGRRWTNQPPWRRSGTENIHLDTAATNSRRKSPWFSGRIRRVSTSTTSRLISGCRWSNKWLLVHVGKLHIPPSRWTQSQTFLGERRIIPYSTEVPWRIQNCSYVFGCQARETHRWLLEYRWIERFVRSTDRFHSIYPIGRKTSKRKNAVGLEINEKTAYIQARSLMARTLGENGERMPSWRRSQSGLRKRSTLKTHENCEGSVPSIRRTRNLRRPSRMLARNWKHQWLLLCPAKFLRRIRIVGWCIQ